jgi:CRISPR system Cascade subunit CasE
MSTLHLMRLALDPAALMRFAQSQGLLRHEDEGHGYVLHAWLAAMFGDAAPATFRHFDKRCELLGYAAADAAALTARAQAFAPPQAWEALCTDSLMTKPMPTSWTLGTRLGIEALTCPVSRKDGHEKDVFLRALDRLGDGAPPRAEVYQEWFRRQWAGAVSFEHVELTSLGRRRLLRRAQRQADAQPRKARSLERPFAAFRATVRMEDPAAFAAHLARGIGRHRAFGFGMVLLSPPA